VKANAKVTLNRFNNSHNSKTQPRVLMVSEPGRDGVFKHVESLCTYLISRGIHVSLAYSDLRGSDQLPLLVERVKNSGGKVLNLRVGNKPALSDIPAILALRKFCREVKPTVIHAHSSKAGGLCRLLPLLGTEVHTVYTPNAYFGMGRDRRATDFVFDCIERCLGRVGVTINVSEDEASYARDRLGIAMNRQFIVRNAVDLNRFTPANISEKMLERERFAIPADALVVGCIARESYQKDLPTLYRGFAEALKAHPNLWLFHVGHGNMGPLCDELRITHRVTRLDYMADTAPFFKTLDAFAMSSRYEGLSIAIIEALGFNLPLVLTDVLGNREFFRLGLSHVWKAIGEDSVSFARGLCDCAEEHAKKTTPNHRAIAADCFGFDSCFGQIIDIYGGAHPSRAAIASAKKKPNESPFSVLVVVEPGDGGVFRHVEGLIHYLMRQKILVHLAYSDRRGSQSLARLVEKVGQAGGKTINLRVLNRPEPTDLIAIAKLSLAIGQIKPNVVHGHSSKAGVLVRTATAFGLGRPVLYTPHAYYGMSRESAQNRLLYSFVESALGQVGTTINISKDEANFGLKTLGVPAYRQNIIPNPVDCDRFRPASADERNAARAQLGLEENHIAIGMVGRMCWQKDPETAYKAFFEVAGKNPRLILLHLGWGKWKDYLLSLARERGLEQQIRIFDYMEDPASFYQGLDALLITSRYEAGWPFVVLEAMATGLPIIGATCPGMEDFGSAGLDQAYTFAPEDTSACAAQLARWLADFMAGKKQNNHREYALARFSPDVCFGAVASLYYRHGIRSGAEQSLPV
jgi:glycosyltransferase involved in cell wall biosynthesis